jgi:hypothetical protein
MVMFLNLVSSGLFGNSGIFIKNEFGILTGVKVLD